MMSLTNAAEELSLIRELEGRIPNLETIESMGIAPFTKDLLAQSEPLQWLQYKECFITVVNDHQIRLVFSMQVLDTFHIYWRKNKSLLEKEDCYGGDNSSWQLMDKFNRFQGKRHVH